MDLLVMAVTRLSDGVCAACLADDNTWIRPTRENVKGWRQLEIRDLYDAQGRVAVKVGNMVRWRINKPIPRDVHSEDYLVGKAPPILLRTLSARELRERTRDAVVQDLAGFLRSETLSLSAVRPASVVSVGFEQSGKGGVTAKIEFRHSGGSYGPYKVTDLAWRAFGRRLLRAAGTGQLLLSPHEFQVDTGMRLEYLVIGRAREFQGKYWPLIISVLTEPANEEPIDYSDT